MSRCTWKTYGWTTTSRSRCWSYSYGCSIGYKKSLFFFVNKIFSFSLGTHVKKPPEKKKKGAEATDPNVQTSTIEAQPLTSPLSVKFKIHKNPTFTPTGESSDFQRETYDGPYVDDDQEELMTYVLTEDIFVEILSARLQVKRFFLWY